MSLEALIDVQQRGEGRAEGGAVHKGPRRDDSGIQLYWVTAKMFVRKTYLCEFVAQM